MDKDGNKTGGRQKGTPNKKNAELRKMFAEFTEDNFAQFKADFQSLKPKERVMVYVEQLKYSVPAMKATEHTIDEGYFHPIILNLGKGIKPPEDE